MKQFGIIIDTCFQLALENTGFMFSLCYKSQIKQENISWQLFGLFNQT